MKSLIESIKEFALTEERMRFRPRRAHYASSALADRRDQYREWTGEPKSNPTDFLGKLRMFLGTAIEEGLIKHWLSKLHRQGHHVLSAQVQVGGNAPAWDGNCDVLMEAEVEPGVYKKYVVEIKTKSGYGADLLWKSGVPSDEYLIQLGLYLRNMHEQGQTSHGCLLYMLLSDSYFGKLLQFDCRYIAETDSIQCYRYSNSEGFVEDKEISYCLTGLTARWQELEQAIKDKVMPKPDYQYKFPITRELLQAQSDATLRRMIANEKVLGDWQAAYSGYKAVNAQTDGGGLGYTSAEIAVIRAYYLELHPKSKL
jgi:hypothetical protein